MSPKKQFLNDLAVFGGRQTFPEPLHVGRPSSGNRERFLELVNDVFDHRWFTNNGPYVREFESKIADLVGTKHCIATCNGTIAIQITTRALALSGEVIVPSMTFIATAHALQWQQIIPVFCDIDPATHNLDPARVEEMITPRTTGIIGTHLWGCPCEIDALEKIAERHGLKIIYDAAHAFGSTYNGHMIGSFGEAEIFSFHATKFFHTFEGGAVVTNNDDLAAKIRLMKNFGFSGYDNVIYIGINGKMSEVSAVMGLASLDSLDEMIKVNRENYKCYERELAGIGGVRLLMHDKKEDSNYQYVILEIDETETGISRDQLMKILHSEGVLARRYFYPGCHRMEPYRSSSPHAGLLLPETERVLERVLSLPTGDTVGSDEISAICQIIMYVIDHSEEVGGRIDREPC